MTQSLEKLSVMLFINGFILFQKLLQIRLRRRNRRDAEVLHQIIQHIRRQESREGGAEPDIFNPQMQQGQQDADCFLLVPGKHHGQGQVVHAAAEGLRQGHCDLNRAVSVITLTDIHDPGQSADGTQIQIIETVFSTGQSQDYGIRRGLLYKIGKITASGTRAVAAAHQEEMPDIPRLHSVNDLVRHAEHRAVSKAVVTVWPPLMPVKS